MNLKFLKTKRKTLIWCVEDWTSLSFIADFVREFYRYKDLGLIKKTTLEIIKNLLEEGLVKAGDLSKDNIFTAWNLPIDDILKRIRLEWDDLGRKLYMYELVWLEITEKGKKALNDLLSSPELNETNPFYFDERKG
jgi:hypothetical protein